MAQVSRPLEVGEVVLATFKAGPHMGITRTAIYLGFNEGSAHYALWTRTITGSTEEFRVVHLPWADVDMVPIGKRVQVEFVPPQWGSFAFRLSAPARWWWPWGRTVFYWTANGYWRWEDDRSAGEGSFYHDSTAPGRVYKYIDAIKEAMRNADLINGLFGQIR